MASKKPERIVAGAPVKHAPVPVKLDPVVSAHTGEACPGVWIETRSDGSAVMVADLSCAMWQAK